MKIKILLPVLAMFIGFSSCVSQEDTISSKETNPSKIEVANNMVTTADYTVPIQEGYTTTVSYKGMLLARTSTPMTIKVPKEAVSRGDDNIDIQYAKGVELVPFTNLWQTVLFEDSKNGDDDYNDLVFHTNYQTKGNNLTVGIQPIALGSTKVIKLGFIWSNGGASGEVIVCGNCRTDLFPSTSGELKGFINTRNYDCHYDIFAREINVKLVDAEKSVNVEWFIEVDKNIRIYAVNQSKNPCIGANNTPYGFALTSVNSNGSNPVATTGDTKEWKAIVPQKPADLKTWAYMPEQKKVPADAMDFKDYKSWVPIAGFNFICKKGETCSNEINGQQGLTIFVEGTLQLRSYYGANATIIVLPGGTLTLGSPTTLLDITILNYGNLNLKGSVIGKGAIVKTTNDLVDNSVRVDPNGTLYVEKGLNVDKKLEVYYGGKVYAESISMENGSLNCEGTLVCESTINAGSLNMTKGNLFASSLYSQGDIYLTTKSKLTIFDGLSCKNYKSDSESMAYIGCMLSCEQNVVVDGSTLSVKGQLYANTFKLNNAVLNMMSGGIAQGASFTINSLPRTRLNVLGKEMAAILFLDFFSDTSDWSQTFVGNWGLNATTINSKYDAWSSITLENNVTTNWRKIIIPKSDCCTGYQPPITEDNGAAWFAYPTEIININTCYNFDKWIKGDFDFEKKPGAKVFDINNDKPAIGKQIKIYAM
ncbi:MAG: hypothetical protein RR061_07110 [Muribaculaceae bacterium]